MTSNRIIKWDEPTAMGTRWAGVSDKGNHYTIFQPSARGTPADATRYYSVYLRARGQYSGVQQKIFDAKHNAAFKTLDAAKRAALRHYKLRCRVADKLADKARRQGG